MVSDEGAEWIGRFKLSERQLSTFTPSKAAIPFPARSGQALQGCLGPPVETARANALQDTCDLTPEGAASDPSLQPFAQHAAFATSASRLDPIDMCAA
jgi:hypothetical protein